MKFYIGSSQSVEVDSQCNIGFHHLSSGNVDYFFPLTCEQFLNLNDILKVFPSCTDLLWFPLGNRVWLYKKDSDVQLVNNRTNRFFRFHHQSWQKYIKKSHRAIISFLRRRDVRVQRYQPHARNEDRPRNQSRKVSSTLQKRQQIISRSTTNADDEDKRASSPNVSKGQGSNSRTDRARRGGDDKKRIYPATEDSGEDEDVPSVSSLDCEYGSEPEITFEH